MLAARAEQEARRGARTVADRRIDTRNGSEGAVPICVQPVRENMERPDAETRARLEALGLTIAQAPVLEPVRPVALAEPAAVLALAPVAREDVARRGGFEAQRRTSHDEDRGHGDQGEGEEYSLHRVRTARTASTLCARRIG